MNPMRPTVNGAIAAGPGVAGLVHDSHFSARELPIREGDHEYAPVNGLWELREAIAGFYNELFRRGRGSKSTSGSWVRHWRLRPWRR